jgi:hypothetical protein
MAWLAAITLNLIIGGQYFDVAVRDLVMAIGAFSLAKLSTLFAMRVGWCKMEMRVTTVKSKLCNLNQ